MLGLVYPLLLWILGIASSFVFPEVVPNTVFPLLQFLIMIWVSALFFGWIWTVGVSLHQHGGATSKLNVKCFISAVIICLCVSIFSMGLFFTETSASFVRGQDFFYLSNLVPFAYLLSLLSYLYIASFIARALVLAEGTSKPNVSKLIGPFLLLLIGYGIFILQPRVNRVFVEK